MMPSICGTMIGELGLPSLVDHHGCVLPMGHDGPHQCVDTRGQAWQWAEDLECACEHCRQCEGDYCVVYWRVLPHALGMGESEK